MKSLANEFFLTMEDGAKAYQKEHADRFELVSNGIKDETDTSSQIRIVEQMIVSGVDALVIAPADSKALVPVVKRWMPASWWSSTTASTRRCCRRRRSACPSSGPTTARVRGWSASTWRSD